MPPGFRAAHPPQLYGLPVEKVNTLQMEGAQEAVPGYLEDLHEE